MTITSDPCALCFFPLNLDRYEVLDLDGIGYACERCFRLAKQDGDLADAIGGHLTLRASSPLTSGGETPRRGLRGVTSTA